MTDSSAAPEKNGNSTDHLLYPKSAEAERRNGAVRRPAFLNADGTAAEPAAEPSPGRGEQTRGRTATLPFPLDDADVAAWEERLNKLPVIIRLGARFDLSDRYAAQVHIDEIRPDHLGGLGVAALNGATIAGIIDCAIGAAGVVHFSGERAGTLNLALNFMKPVLGKRVTARCIVTRKTKTLLFTEACVLDRRGSVCVTATGIVSKVS
ncbi:MAG TPA: PaaI family thioesterase [Stellaceae bacterium]|jgi:acyl-coenzyme A thioesterase PaaI-like protein